MKPVNRFAPVLLALSLPLLGACHSSSPPPADNTTAATKAPDTMLGKVVDKAMAKAREELESGNLGLNGGLRIGEGGSSVWSTDGNDGLPRAEITPKGDLLVEGKPVEIDATQRGLLLDYRQQIIGIAEAGMAIGSQGADLAGKALAEGLASVFSGGKADFEQRMEAEGRKMEAQARKLCDRLPAMLAAQDKLAAALPEFKPYARMSREDIDDCYKDGSDDAPAMTDAERAQLQDNIRRDIREGVRGAVQAAVVTDEPAGTAR